MDLDAERLEMAPADRQRRTDPRLPRTTQVDMNLQHPDPWLASSRREARHILAIVDRNALSQS